MTPPPPPTVAPGALSTGTIFSCRAFVAYSKWSCTSLARRSQATGPTPSGEQPTSSDDDADRCACGPPDCRHAYQSKAASRGPWRIRTPSGGDFVGSVPFECIVLTRTPLLPASRTGHVRPRFSRTSHESSVATWCIPGMFALARRWDDDAPTRVDPKVPTCETCSRLQLSRHDMMT
jgi:hypothetical protein